MIVKVTEALKETMMNYVKKEPSINLFIIGDVEQYGLDNDFQEVFLQYEDNKITACVLRYYTNVVVYSDNNHFDKQEIVNLINTFDYNMLNGKKEVVDYILPLFNNIKKVDECFFCELDNDENLLKNEFSVKVATVNDLPKILEILKLVDFHSDNYIESNTRKLETKAGRIYFVENEIKVISTASTAIETSVSAMIVGVTTHNDYRKQGLASQVVSKLSYDLLKENKKPCLFYHNPLAGKIYHNLGFKDIDKWTMVKFDRK